jgi:tripartite-type tricarboxylate transporter receptor subunit TctC
MTNRRQLITAATALGTPATWRLAHAQAGAWPNRPVRVVVPFVGGSMDITARIFTPRLTEIFGQPFIVENRGGAGGTVGTNHVARQPADGYTVLFASISSTALAPALYASLPYDPLTDLVAISPVVQVPLGLVVSTRDFAPRTAQELMAELKANPGKYQFGSGGVGTSGHLATSSFLTTNGCSAVHVPYRGGGEAFTAMVAGTVQFMHDVPGTLKPFHDAGTMRCVLVNTEARSPHLPDVPTTAEAGVPPYPGQSWFGLFGPAGMPSAVVERLGEAMQRIIATPEVRKQYADAGFNVMTGHTPQSFSAFVRRETEIWAPIVRASGARAN